MPRRTPGLFPGDPARNTPSAQSIIAHCDGGARGNPGPAGYGAEITDVHGNVLAELSEFLGIRTNNFAEYSGLLATLQYALDHGHSDLRVISDSELMVKQICGQYKVKSPDLLPLFQEAKRRIAKLSSFEITHALRHKNKAADRLANDAMDRGMKRGTPAEGRAFVAKPDGTLPAQDGVRSLPLRAIPYPARAVPAPPKSAIHDPLELVPQPGGPAPTRNTHLPMIITAEPQRLATSDSEKESAVTAKPERPSMLRGFTRNGAVHLLGPDRLPDGIFVKVIPE